MTLQVPISLAENAIERQLLSLAGVQLGLNYGLPRYGHPEGSVWSHVQEIFTNIDKMALEPSLRSRLRQVAIIHDAFKYKEAHLRKIGQVVIHHSILAREAAESVISDELTLDLIEFHDEPYFAWRDLAVHNHYIRCQARLEFIKMRFDNDLPILLRFFVVDTLTGDKLVAPLTWTCNLFGYSIEDFFIKNGTSSDTCGL